MHINYTIKHQFLFSYAKIHHTTRHNMHWTCNTDSQAVPVQHVHTPSILQHDLLGDIVQLGPCCASSYNMLDNPDVVFVDEARRPPWVKVPLHCSVADMCPRPAGLLQQDVLFPHHVLLILEILFCACLAYRRTVMSDSKTVWESDVLYKIGISSTISHSCFFLDFVAFGGIPVTTVSIPEGTTLCQGGAREARQGLDLH